MENLAVANYQSPYVLALVVCDAIWRDPGTRKHTILGTFSSIGSRSYPARHPVMAFFIALTDGRGKTPLNLRLVSVDEDRTVFSEQLEVEFADPRTVVELSAHVKDLEFPKPGEYRLQLLCGEEHLMERRITAVLVPE